jgi:ligand-binding sensor domain-containing protein
MAHLLAILRAIAAVAHAAFALQGAGPPSLARSTPAAPEDPPRFVHEAWTVDDGLPVNSVNAVLQSRDGYIWLATWDGLVRFDGARFALFNTGNTEGLPSNRIIRMMESADGALWLLTEQDHLVRVRRGEFLHLDRSHGVPEGGAKLLYEDRAGTVWIGTTRGVGSMRGDRFIPVAERAIAGQVVSLHRDAGGALWVGTLGATGSTG